MGFLQNKKSLDELQEEDEQLTTEVSISKKRAIIKRLKEEYGGNYITAFSDNGKKSGFSWQRALEWLKTH